MTPEELLTPRYKVIADYPLSKFILGSILVAEKDRLGGWYFPYKGMDSIPFDITQYPNIFKPLEWWEERKKKDLPKYLRYEKGSYVSKRGIVVMADDWEQEWRTGSWWFRLEGAKLHTKFAGDYSPVTVEEYHAYLNKQEVK